MPKLKESVMPSDDKLEKIRSGLTGDDLISCQYAIRDCAVYRVYDDICIAALKRLKSDDSVWGIKISAASCAALDIIQVEEYLGSDNLIRELIETQFYSKMEN